MRIKKTIADIAILIGIIVVLCAAGGSDTGMFNIEQTLLRVIIGIILTIVGSLYGAYLQKNFK